MTSQRHMPMYSSSLSVHLNVWWRDHLHLPYLAVDDVRRQIELVHHAEWDRATTRLRVVHLPLDDVGVNVRLLRQDFRCTGSRRAATDYCHSVLRTRRLFFTSRCCSAEYMWQ